MYAEGLIFCCCPFCQRTSNNTDGRAAPGQKYIARKLTRIFTHSFHNFTDGHLYEMRLQYSAPVYYEELGFRNEATNKTSKICLKSADIYLYLLLI